MLGIFKNKNQLPIQPNKIHKPFRWRHLALLLIGILIGVFGTFRSGYIEKPKFDVNSVSPGVVKIYHIICGTIVFKGEIYAENACSGGTGSGSLISSDGYIATSGHVVVTDPADILAEQLSSNPRIKSKFEVSSGLQISDTTAQQNAAILKKLYSLPKEDLKLENKKEAIFVALGDRPLVTENKTLRQIMSITDTDYVKRAELVASDYSPKDIINLEGGDGEGFTARDVALLKIAVKNAPILALGDSEKVNQNDPLSLIGFPSDADNQLTDNDRIVPTVTNGNVSSIRTTTGVSSLLFQSDADASQGNSGGPAINANGEIFGIVTYRYKDQESVNAAKSYIRDIDELKELLKENNIKLNRESESLHDWQQGLLLASKDKYSKAILEYKNVQQIYPAHRLAGFYVNKAEGQIKAGKDVKDPPYLLFLTVGSILTGIVIIMVAAALITRHRIQHTRYKNSFV